MTRLIGWGALLVLLVPNFFCVVARRENWPFSRYPMFSAPPPHPVKSEYGLVGITESGARFILKDYAPNNHQFMASHHFQQILALDDGLHRVERLGRRLALQHNRISKKNHLIQKVEFCRFDYPVSERGVLDERRPNVSVVTAIDMGS